MKKKIHQIGTVPCITFTEKEMEERGLEVGRILNMDDCFIEKEEPLTEEESYNQDKKMIINLEGEFAPGRLKQINGTIIIQ